MALTLTDPETERLARELARRRGTSIDEAVREALRASAEETATSQEAEDLAERILAIGRRCGALPRRTDRTPDEIIGYDERGLPS